MAYIICWWPNVKGAEKNLWSHAHAISNSWALRRCSDCTKDTTPNNVGCRLYVGFHVMSRLGSNRPWECGVPARCCVRSSDCNGSRKHSSAAQGGDWKVMAATQTERSQTMRVRRASWMLWWQVQTARVQGNTPQPHRGGASPFKSPFKRQLVFPAGRWTAW